MRRRRRRLGILLLWCLLAAPGCGSEEGEYTPSVLDEVGFETLEEAVEPLPAVAPALRPRVVSLAGRVLTPEGRSQSGARVELLRRPRIGEEPIALEALTVLASTTTNEKGAWRLRAKVAGPVLLRAARGDLTLVGGRAVPWSGGRIDLRARELHAVHLGIFTEVGETVRLASIAYVAHDPAGARLAQPLAHAPAKRSDVAWPAHVGVVTAMLPHAEGELLVRAPGRATVRSPAMIPMRRHDIGRAITLPEARAVDGRVVRAADEVPVANAEVWIREPRLGGLVERRIRTGADGRFDARVAPDSTVDIRVRAEGFGPAYQRLVVTSETGADPVLRLAPPAYVQGRVLDPSGKPVADATLQWLDGFPRDTWEPGREGPPDLVSSDERGRFAIPWPAGSPGPGARVLIAVSDRHGYVTARVPEPTGQRRLRLRLGGMAPVRGSIRTFQNDPLEGASVRLEREDVHAAVARGAPPWPRVAHALRTHLPGFDYAVADAEGRFAVPCVPAGSWRLSVRYGEQELVDAGAVRVQHDAVPGGIDIRFPHGPHALEVRVEDHDLLTSVRGRRLPKAETLGYARLQPARGERGDGWSMRVPIPRSGHVTLPGLADMPYHVQVVAPGYVLGRLPAASPSRGPVHIRLEPTPAVQVTAAQGGRRLPSTVLFVARPAPEGYGHDRGEPLTIAGRPLIEASDGSLTSALTAVSRHQHSELILRMPAGPFLLPSLARGSYDVALFSLDGWATPVQPVDLPARTLVHTKGTRFTRTGAFRAHVVDEEDRPLAGVRCGIEPAARSVILARGRTRTRTDGNGAVRFPGLMAGAYAFTIERPDGLRSQQLVAVSAGGDEYLRLVVRKPGALNVHVEDADGIPIAGAHVQLLTKRGLQVGPRPSGRTDKEGVLRIAALAPDAYDVIVRAVGLASPTPLPEALVRSGTRESVTVTMAKAPRRGK